MNLFIINIYTYILITNININNCQSQLHIIISNLIIKQYNRMKESALQDYTKQKKLYGQNQQQILDKFVQYASMCSDPMNIYTYMEKKSICIYLANYWTNRAILFADMGDFRNAILCLKQAKLRDHIVNENQVRIEDFIQRIKKKMVTAMKRTPPKVKRLASQYDFLYEKEKKTTIQSLQTITQIFEKNYKEAKKQIQKQFELKMHGKNKSWLASIQEENQQNLRKISQKMKSMNHHQFNNCLSANTPISKKDPMRLTKTMDSVQMLKKKKSTQPKQKKLTENNSNQNFSDKVNNCDEYSDQMEEEQPICTNTTPVGRQMSILSRRVTFNTKGKFDQIQKIRGEQRNKQGHNDTLQKIQHRDGQKSLSRRGSILKNKKIFENMEGQDEK